MGTDGHGWKDKTRLVVFFRRVAECILTDARHSLSQLIRAHPWLIFFFTAARPRWDLRGLCVKRRAWESVAVVKPRVGGEPQRPKVMTLRRRSLRTPVQGRGKSWMRTLMVCAAGRFPPGFVVLKLHELASKGADGNLGACPIPPPPHHRHLASRKYLDCFRQRRPGCGLPSTCPRV